MNTLIIDGERFEVDFAQLARTAEFKDKYGVILTEDGMAQRELVGVYYTYQLSIGFDADVVVYEKLWNALTKPQSFHNITVPGTRGDYNFEAYFENVGDEFLVTNEGENFFKGLTVNFIARSPAV